MQCFVSAFDLEIHFGCQHKNASQFIVHEARIRKLFLIMNAIKLVPFVATGFVTVKLLAYNINKYTGSSHSFADWHFEDSRQQSSAMKATQLHVGIEFRRFFEGGTHLQCIRLAFLFPSDDVLRCSRWFYGDANKIFMLQLWLERCKFDLKWERSTHVIGCSDL